MLTVLCGLLEVEKLYKVLEMIARVYALRPCLVREKFEFWYCSTFRCYLIINIQL